MTVIVGLRHAGRVYIGGDSAGVAGYSLAVRADEKVFKNGEYVFGFTSSFRMGQLLRYNLTPPAPRENVDPVTFMSTEFIDAVRDVLKKGGFAKVDNAVEQGGEFLVGWRGGLYHVGLDFQVGAALTDFDACGVGEDVALGAMQVLETRDPRARVRRALEAAEAWNAAVRGPFTIVSTASSPA